MMIRILPGSEKVNHNQLAPGSGELVVEVIHVLHGVNHLDVDILNLKQD